LEQGHKGFWLRRVSAAATVALFAAAPFYVFRGTVQDATTNPRLEFTYLVTGWGPWVLITLGALCFIPVALSIGTTGYSRLYLRPATRHAYEAWGGVLYFLGMVLAVQSSQIASAY
jgi:hypothetical protein